MARGVVAGLAGVVLIAASLALGGTASAATFATVVPTPQNPIANYGVSQTYSIGISGASATVARCIAIHYTYSTLTLPSPANSKWQYAGGSVTDGSTITLTNPAQSFAGTSAIYNSPMPVDGLSATFDGYMGGGGGADGMTFVMLDATSWGGFAGAIGGGLGYSGLTGVAVTMDTSQNGSDPSSNFIGIATSGTGSNITYASTSTGVPALRNTPRHYEITATSTTVTVKVDGVQYLSTTVTLPSMVLAGFTAGTGGSSDYHQMSGINITSTGVGPTGTASYKPAGMGTSGPTITGSTAVNGSNWSIDSGAGDMTSWIYSTGQALTDGNLAVNNITRNASVPGTYHARVETFSDIGCSSAIDTGYGSFTLVDYTNTSEVSVSVQPSLTFSVAGYNSGSCNGATLTATGSTSTAVPLGRPTTGANVIGGQSLQVSTNAQNGYSITARYVDALKDTGGTRTIADWTGTNATPTAFPAAGTEAFGYTTDHALSGSATRFQTNKWAKLTTSPAQVSYSSGTASADTAHVCYQVGIDSNTKAGSYSSTVVYTVVATF